VKPFYGINSSLFGIFYKLDIYEDWKRESLYIDPAQFIQETVRLEYYIRPQAERRW